MAKRADSWASDDLIATLGDQIKTWLRTDPTIGRGRLAVLVHEKTGKYCSQHAAREAITALADSSHNPVTGGRQKVEVKEDTPFDRTLLARGSRIRTLEDLLRVTRTDLDTWVVTAHTINSWEQGAKSDSGTDITTLFQVKARLERRVLEDVKPAEPIKLTTVGASPRPDGPVRKALFIPDTQHGHRWTDNYTRLEPMHDRRAIDVVMQIAKLWNPDVIVLLGDMLDLAPWSMKFKRAPDIRQTTQPTIDELYWQLCQLRLVFPLARIVWLEGNHERRIQNALIERIPEAVDLRAAGEERPTLSIPRLLQLDSLNIEYVGPYPQDWWLWDRIQLAHGQTHGRGVTNKLALKKGFSMVKGHGHGLETAYRRVDTPQGLKVISVMQPGCLCRIDGAVPGVTTRPDWQHGVGFAVYDEATKQEHLWASPIHDGRMIFEGRVIEGADRAVEIATATGHRQLQ